MSSGDPFAMNPLTFLLVCIAGLVNRRQQLVIMFFQVEGTSPLSVVERRACLSLFAAVACLLLLGAHVRAADAASRPNIILILADDQGYGDVSCYNDQSKVQTPNIDRIAREGIRFRDGHSPASVCSPSRYAILTGRHAWRGRLKLGVLQQDAPALIEEGRLTWPAMLGRRAIRPPRSANGISALPGAPRRGSPISNEANGRRTSISANRSPMAHDTGIRLFLRDGRSHAAGRRLDRK